MIELNNINLNFKEIEHIDLNTNHIFKLVKNRISIFKEIYNSHLISENENVLLFGLDALHYQMSLLEYEYNSLLNMYKLITNKIYSQYYKLLKIITHYINNLKEFKEENREYLIYINNKKKDYPVYKDLELFKEYDFRVIKCLQSDIFDIINKLILFIHKKEDILKNDKELSNNGINIDIFVNAIQFDILIVKQNIDFYKNYLNIFNRYHIQYYSRLNIKLLILLGQINTDVKFEELNKYNRDKIDLSFNLFKYEMELLGHIQLPDKFKEEFENIKINIQQNDKEINLENNEIEHTYTSYNSKELLLENKMNLYDIGSDIGHLTTEELKNKWNSILNDVIHSNSDHNTNDDNSYIQSNNDIIIDRDYNTTITNSNDSVRHLLDDVVKKIEDDIESIKSDKDEIDKWREIITNNEMTQEEKKKLKAKLKRKKRKDKNK